MKLSTEPVRRKNMEKHNKTLKVVLQRVMNIRITFNPDKCQFRVEEKILWKKIHKGRIKAKPKRKSEL